MRPLFASISACIAFTLLEGATLQAQMRPYPGPYPYGRYRLAQPESDLRIEVSPKEAEVYVDGYFAGKVDDFDGVFQRLHLTPGEHEIVIHLAGYRAMRERLYLSINTTRKIEGRLEPLQPGEANEPAPTPADAPDAGADANDPGNRRGPAGRGGYPPRAPLPPGRMPPGLDPDRPLPGPPSNGRSGSLVIRVQPEDAEVLIDGERWRGPSGSERLVVQVYEGRHRVEVRKEGYESYADDVEVRRGDSVPLNVSLNRK